MAWYDFALRGADRLVRAAEDAIATLGDAIESVGEEIAEDEIGISGRERRRRRRRARKIARERRAGIFRARLEENRRRQREAKGKPPRKPRKRRKAKPLPPLPPRPTPEVGQEYALLRLDSGGRFPSNPVMVREDYRRRAWTTEETGHLSADSLIDAGVPIYSMAYAYWFDDRPLPYVLYVGPS
jgi:hypothetical protein